MITEQLRIPWVILTTFFTRLRNFSNFIPPCGTYVSSASAPRPRPRNRSRPIRQSRRRSVFGKTTRTGSSFSTRPRWAACPAHGPRRRVPARGSSATWQPVRQRPLRTAAGTFPAAWSKCSRTTDSWTDRTTPCRCRPRVTRTPASSSWIGTGGRGCFRGRTLSGCPTRTSAAPSTSWPWPYRLRADRSPPASRKVCSWVQGNRPFPLSFKGMFMVHYTPIRANN